VYSGTFGGRKSGGRNGSICDDDVVVADEMIYSIIDIYYLLSGLTKSFVVINYSRKLGVIVFI
jgi:hypothetical protein